MADYLVNLYDMDPSWSPEKLEEAGITIRRVLSPDKGKVMEFVRKYYEGGWESECEHAFSHDPITCYIAVQKGEIIGFSCFDATAKAISAQSASDRMRKGTAPARLSCAQRCLACGRRAMATRSSAGRSTRKAFTAKA